MNQLYFGDCLDVLKDLHNQYPQGFVDLIYIDPPFNSKRNYNVLFEDAELEDTKAQKEAFADTWSNISYIDTLNEIAELNIDLFNLLKAFDENSGISNDAVSYLTTMGIRIYYMYKLLNDTGSFYLHCDPTMSHYLKIMCDIIFGYQQFGNEIVWKRTSAHSNAIGYGSSIDIILFYIKGSKFKWNQQFTPYEEDYINTYYRYIDESGRRFMSSDLVGHKGVNKEYEWKGITRAWRYPKQRLDELEKENRIFWTRNKFPRYKRFLDEMPGMPVQNIWTDIQPVVSWSKEGLGFPTQKPIALMERIINSSSNEDDLVADFFCGCGTTIAAAEKLNRKWMGVDISHLAIKLISKRLDETYGIIVNKDFEIHGMPKDIASARELANEVKGGRLEFEEWIIEVLLHGVLNERRNELGYDGYLTFSIQNKKQIVMIEVKSGNASASQLNHFIQTAAEKKASMGVFVCFEDQVSKKMREIAKRQGYYNQEMFGNNYDKFQILTVEDLLNGIQPKLPASTVGVFKSSEKVKKQDATQGKFDL